MGLSFHYFKTRAADPIRQICPFQFHAADHQLILFPVEIHRIHPADAVKLFPYFFFRTRR